LSRWICDAETQAKHAKRDGHSSNADEQQRPAARTIN
jgi:hypothetical protein